MINTRVLLKAMSFMCLPTASILFLLFCYFFSWTLFVDFITSQNGWAAFIRIVVVIIELVLVCIMYNYYLDREKYIILEDKLKNGDFRTGNKIKNNMPGYTNLRDIIPCDGKESYCAYKTDFPDVYILEKYESKN